MNRNLYGVLLALWWSLISASAMTVANDLRCEYLTNPLGIDTVNPRLSWVLAAGKTDREQTAYQILVASSKRLLNVNNADLWDSGKVISEDTSQITYAGKPLKSSQVCFWKIRLWNENGQSASWSQPAFWTMGLLKPEDWQGRWIGRIEKNTFSNAQWIWSPEGNPVEAAPSGTRFFRRTLALPPGRKLVAAICTATADNTFELAINGGQAGSGYDWREPAVLDIAALLHPGENQVVITATNLGSAPTPAGLIAKIHLEFSEGDPLDFFSDNQWETSTNDSQWTPAKVLGAYGIAPWGNVFEDAGRRLPARYLRREFTVKKKITRATAYACGLGFFDLFLNGGKVSDDVMDPALSDYAKSDYYVTFDVTKQLQGGKNAVGVTLGNGRFFAPRLISPIATQTFNHPQLLLQLEIEYADGTRETIASDEQWRLTTEGPIRANNEYDGETYDARMELPGWNKPGFDDSKWEPAELVPAPGNILRAQMIEPMRVTKVLKPVAITNPKPGVFEVDFGQNFYGAVQLKARGAAGTTVQMTCAYSLLPDGTLKTADNRGAKTTDIYTFKGGSEETWSPRFKGQGFRRVQVTGFPGTPTMENFTALVIHTDVQPVGEFECSNDLINQIHAAMRRGMEMFLRSAPLDPDRDERQAWMGDPAKDAESEAFNFNVAPFYTKWMDDVRQSQRSDGSIPDVAMYWTMGDGVEWASVFTIIPDWMADFYGDHRVAKMNYAAMKKWVLAMRRHELPDGTLKATSYGDWCDTYTMDGKVSDFGATPQELVSSAYQYHNYRIMERLAGQLGELADQHQFSGLADELKLAFNRKFLEPKTHVYQGATQCGYVLALAFDLVPPEQRDAVITNLVDDILVKHNGHLSTGLIGIQWLMQTLTDIGRPDVAWTIATQITRPSWGYMLGKGATTIWERWDCDTRDPGMNSEALLIQAGNVDAWFYQTLAGINYDSAQPAFKHIIIKPAILGDLTWVKAHFDCLHGRIVSQWKRTGKKLTLNIAIPPNTTATIFVPRTDSESVQESGKPAPSSKQVKFLRQENHTAVYETGPGTYQFDSHYD